MIVIITVKTDSQAENLLKQTENIITMKTTSELSASVTLYLYSLFLLFFPQMQPSFILSTIFLFGIITLSSSNRIPSGYQLCRVACANHARNCRFIDDCPSSCAKDDYHCSLQVCLDMSCTSKGKRDQIETTEVQI